MTFAQYGRVAAFVGFCLFAAVPAHADPALEDEARALMDAFTAAVASGEADQLDAVLAPEYQIVRANGVTYDKAGYIERRAGGVKIENVGGYENVVATQGGDVMVISSVLTITETIDGQSVTKKAPRLTVFRKIDGAWKVSSHANFARPE